MLRLISPVFSLVDHSQVRGRPPRSRVFLNVKLGPNQLGNSASLPLFYAQQSGISVVNAPLAFVELDKESQNVEGREPSDEGYTLGEGCPDPAGAQSPVHDQGANP